MRMLSTHLVNVCQHADLQVDFTAGMVGIYARNGRGKSNLMNVGGYANLTNDYRRTNGTRAECIRRGAGPSDPSFYETHWEHNGVRFAIKRDLRRESHALKVEGREKALTSSKDIQGWLDGVLKVRRQVIDNYLFVNQLQMFNFIEQTPAERSETFSHLCGTTYMQKIHDEIGERIKADLPLSADVIDNSDELRQQIGEAKKKRRSAKAGLEELQPKLLPKLKFKEFRKTVAKRRNYRRFLEELTTAKGEQITRRTAWEDAALATLEAGRALAAAQTLFDETKAAADEAEKSLQSYETVEKKNKDIDTVVGAIAKLKKPTKPEQPEGYAKKGFVAEKLADLKAELKQAQAAVDTFEKGGKTVCPTCGTAASDVETHLVEYRKIVKGHPAKIADYQSRLQTYETYEGAANDYKTDLATYRTKLENLETKKVELGEKQPLPKVDKVAVQRLVDKHEDADTALTEAKTTERRSAMTVTAAKTKFDETTQQVEKLRADVKKNKVDKPTAVAARKALATHQGAASQIAVLKERISNASADVLRAETQLADIEAAKARTLNVRNWLKDLETMQTEVFHRSKLPRMVNEDALGTLLDHVNATLADVFGDPFSVKIGEGLAFTAVKPDGDESSARLSGGEKAVLAIAFRLAINSIFAGEIGMMVLDEPTVGLDEENIECLQNALEALAAYSRKRGTQIIIITHDKRLESAFDKIIRL